MVALGIRSRAATLHHRSDSHETPGKPIAPPALHGSCACGLQPARERWSRGSGWRGQHAAGARTVSARDDPGFDRGVLRQDRRRRHVSGGHVSEILACATTGCAGEPQRLVHDERVTRHARSARWAALLDRARRTRRRRAPHLLRGPVHSAPSSAFRSVLTRTEADDLVATRVALFWTEAVRHQIHTMPIPVEPRP
jgi:hypothetical protein